MKFVLGDNGPMKSKALLIENPTAGPWDMTRSLKRLAFHFSACGYPTTLVQTHNPGDATRYAAQAAQDGMGMVFVAGGDGTINEVVNGLAGSSTALGIVPVGTGNILAHQLNIPILSTRSLVQAREIGDVLLNGRIQRVDLGLVNERYFACWAGVGLDAEIAVQMEPRPRFAKRFHALPYMIAAFMVASEFRGVRSRVRIEDRTFRTRALMVLVSNIQLYASFFNIAPHARMDDGLLDIFVFKGLGFSYVLRYLVQFLGSNHLRDPKVMHALARNIQVETQPCVAVHLDGDPFCATPAAVSLQAGALRLLVPTQAPRSLFSKAPEKIL